jgi:hypothetical protein
MENVSLFASLQDNEPYIRYMGDLLIWKMKNIEPITCVRGTDVFRSHGSFTRFQKKSHPSGSGPLRAIK